MRENNYKRLPRTFTPTNGRKSETEGRRGLLPTTLRYTKVLQEVSLATPFSTWSTTAASPMKRLQERPCFQT